MNKQKWIYLILSLAIILSVVVAGCGSQATQSTTQTPVPTNPVSIVSVTTLTPPYKLTILHTSENHGHWETVEVSKVSQGGIGRRATLVKQLRAENPNTLLLDSGDISQGTLYYSVYKGTEGKELYNLLGYDAVALGNHEFDPGPKILADNFLNGATFSVVIANMDFTSEPALGGKVLPSVTKTVGGEKIGIFGLITDEVTVTSSPGPNIKMKDTVQAAKDMVAEMTRQGINKIILLSHLGFSADQDLAARVSGIDVIVSGHTDTLMGDPDKLDASLGKPVAPYPTVVNSPGSGRTLIVHDYVWGRLLGDIDLVFDNAGNIISYTGGPRLVDKNIVDDPMVTKRLDEEYKPKVEILKRTVVGSTSIAMDGRRAIVRNQESNLGNMEADAMLWNTSKDKTTIAIANGGGIRASISTGNITVGQVLEALPFSNQLVQVDLSGAELLDALENGISDIKANPEESGGRFPQVAGFKFSANLGKPVGQRVTEVMTGSSASGYKPLDLSATYRIVTLDFIKNGGDGYTMFKNGKNVRGGDVPQEMAVIDYLLANSPVSPKVEGRITLTK